MTTACKASLLWHREDTITLHKSTAQPQCKQTCFEIHSSVYIYTLDDILPTFACPHMRCNYHPCEPAFCSLKAILLLISDLAKRNCQHQDVPPEPEHVDVPSEIVS